MSTAATASVIETTVPQREEWFRWNEPRPNARLSLVCLPHAGGAASSFRDWPRQVSQAIDVCPVQLPGRENRGRTPPFTKMGPLLEALVAALRPHIERPYAIYGHSLGALIGFELVRRLRHEGRPLPLCLFVASRRAPQLKSPVPTIHRLSDDGLVEWLKRAAGTSDILLKNERWLRFYLPALRADLELSEAYHYTAEAPLPCPIFAFCGTQDAVLTRDELDAWREQTTARFTLDCFPGGHLFYLSSSPAAGHVAAFEPELLRSTVAKRALGLLASNGCAHE